MTTPASSPTPLPAVPNLDQFKRRARELLKAMKAGDATAAARFAAVSGRRRGSGGAAPKLSDAQLVLAREYGFGGWPALVEHVQDVLAKTEQERQTADAIDAIADAAQRGDLAKLRALLGKYPQLINVRHDRLGQPPLHLAAWRGHPKAVRWLLDHGADATQRCKGDNALALHFAAEIGSLEIVRLLVEHGADVNAAGDDHELGVIGWATCFHQMQRGVAEFLLAHGARHHIFSAVAMNDLEAVRQIVATDPAALTRRLSRNESHRAALAMAALRDLPEMVALLLDLGADRDARDDKGWTPIDLAVRRGKARAYRVLAARGAKPDTASLAEVGSIEHAATVFQLHEAIRRNDLAVVRAMVEADPSLAYSRLPDMYGGGAKKATALHWTAWEGRIEIAEYLLSRGADMNLRDEVYTADPAGWAEENHQPEMRDFFIARGCDSAMVHAARLGRIELLKACLKANPDIGRFPWPPTHAAVQGNQAESIKVLAQAGADLNTPNGGGNNALHLAAGAGNLRIATALLRHGANPNFANHGGNRALHAALGAGDLRMVAALLKGGADPNAANDGGATPLPWTVGAKADGLAIAQALLAAGADAQHRDHQGRTALDEAVTANKSDLAELFRQWVAARPSQKGKETLL